MLHKLLVPVSSKEVIWDTVKSPQQQAGNYSCNICGDNSSKFDEYVDSVYTAINGHA